MFHRAAHIPPRGIVPADRLKVKSSGAYGVGPALTAAARCWLTPQAGRGSHRSGRTGVYSERLVTHLPPRPFRATVSVATDVILITAAVRPGLPVARGHHAQKRQTECKHTHR